MTAIHEESIDWDADVAVDDEEVYESLMRAIARTESFGLFFVRCIEKDRAKLEQRIKADLPKLRFERLELQEELKDGNLYRRVAEVSQRLGTLNGLFISGLEKSLDPYVKSGYGGLGDYYNTDMVPRLLGHLNLQRERFRDDFPFCLIFFLSAFGIKYIARRAPDFFDWRSGLFEFVADEAKLGRLTQELWGNYSEYLIWTEKQRLDRIQEIQALIDEDRQTSAGKASLFLEKANILAASQSYKAAIATYDKAIESKTNNHSVWNNRGVALNHLNLHEEALTSFDKAIENKTNYHQALYGRGLALGYLNRHEEALTSFDKAIELKPDKHEVWFNRGIALSNFNRYEEAIASYNKAIELKPDDHEAWYNIGNARGNLKHDEEAIVSYDKAIKFKSDKHEAWNNRGNALFNLKRYEEAIASYDKAIELKSDKHEAWFNRGIALFNLKRHEEAIASYDKAIEFNLGYYEAWFSRGLALGSLKYYEKALNSYNKAIDFKPDNHEVWFNLGVALFNLKRYEEAITSYDKAIEFKPSYQRAWYNRACSHALQGKIKLAFTDLEEAFRLNPEESQKLAATDSDLESLREDPRFAKLLDLAPVA